MSVVEISADLSIASVVEAMLPRFSDHKLGLYFNVQLDLVDHGFGEDGNTRVREGMTARSDIHFLFVRPDNYTQVYVLVERAEEDRKYVLNGHNLYEWQQTSNHDSCWRSDGFRPLTDEYFRMAKPFPMAPKDITQFNHLVRDPTYVEVEIESVDPKADRFTPESRQFIIDLKPIRRDRLEQVAYKDKRYSVSGEFMSDITSGVLIKGSEDHESNLKTKARCDEKYGELT